MVMGALDRVFNRRSWRKLNIQPLEQAASIPAEFRKCESVREFGALDEQPTLTMEMAPFTFSSAARGYMNNFTVQEMRTLGRPEVQETLSGRLPLSLHTYEDYSLVYEQSRMRNAAPERPVTEGFLKILHARLPKRQGRSELLEDIGTGISDFSQAYGTLVKARFSASMGWLPPPELHAPHHDGGGSARRRVFVAAQGSGPLVIPTASLPERDDWMVANYDADHRFLETSSNYPRFSELKGQIYSVSEGTAVAWRHGGTVTDGQPYEKGAPALPHGVYPYNSKNNRVRINVALDYVR